jgi:hypothetical protein
MATFEKIATVDVGLLGSASIEFTSIPSTFTDLCLKFSGRGSNLSNVIACNISFNSSTSSFTGKMLLGNGSAAASYNTTRDIGYANASNSTSNTFGNMEIYIPNYAGSANKSFSVDTVAETNATNIEMTLISGLWSNSAAITSVSITPAAGTFVQYSSATLYGITKA